MVAAVFAVGGCSSDPDAAVGSDSSAEANVASEHAETDLPNEDTETDLANEDAEGLASEDTEASLKAEQVNEALDFFAASGAEPDALRACLVDRFEREGHGFATTGDGWREIVALTGCDPDALRVFHRMPITGDENPMVGDHVDCALDILSAHFAEVPFDRADEFLASEAFWEPVSTTILAACDITRRQLENIFS